MSRQLDGTGVTAATGVGTAWWLDDSDPADLSSPPDPGTVDPSNERDRFETAREAVRAALTRERDRTAREVGEEEAAVFDAHVEFLTDPAIESAVAEAIETGRPAPHAVRDAFAGHIETFEAMEGRMAERADDLRDVRDRLLRELSDTDVTDGPPDGAVVLATRLTPSEVTRLDPDRVAGVATVLGGGTAHAAILLRSMGIPAVVGVGEDLRSVDDGATVGVDAATGTVHIDPDLDVRERLESTDGPPVIHDRVTTSDGTAVEVAANIGSAAEARAAAERGADGVGLFRTEFLFLDRDAPPDEDEQYGAYRDALAAFTEPVGGDHEDADPHEPPDRVIVRTLDVGGDKDVPYLDLDPIENGFLGVRGIRFSLGPGRALFETQLRACCRAAAGGPLAVMFPLVSTPGELEEAIAVLDDVLDGLRTEGVECARPELGVMVETPAAALSAAALARRVSFLSIGTNDLSGYVMAAQRDVDAVSSLADPLQPAVLRAIDRTVRGAREEDAWVGVCGEMAADPDLTRLLVGLGVEELSMAAPAVPAVKAAVTAIDDDEARSTAEAALDAETPAQIRSMLSPD
ncbi:phosphoenolpyruvate--protein phosphotransferase [Halorubrum vacuolatum]|uniref:Phosphoenolpyruvate-protein phosphotransferase n=1 Tax=Halorubrum vacuolatum TaxID=63740 RepID=A0A238W148_HALVU|nr:phosphoenolpyruvate--protein phosphotransferase [Halorubrum vacuolatum]SNR40218.1 phosphotransferase system, enzyme I, PtsI [Halorubrum vacuolatum]